MSFLINPYRYVTAAVATKLWESVETGEAEGLWTNGLNIAGELFETGHVLMGATPTKVIFNLKKTGAASGPAELKLINSSNVEKASFGTVDMGDLDGTFTATPLENATNTATIADGDRLAWYYDGAQYFYFELCASCSENYTEQSKFVSGSWTNTGLVCTMEVWGYAA